MFKTFLCGANVKQAVPVGLQVVHMASQWSQWILKWSQTVLDCPRQSQGVTQRDPAQSTTVPESPTESPRESQTVSQRVHDYARRKIMQC